MNSNKKESPRKEGTLPPQLKDEIRARAYELYEKRGREDGHEVDDWVQAENEVLSAQGTIKAA